MCKKFHRHRYKIIGTGFRPECIVDLSKFNERTEKRKEAIKLRKQMDKKRKEIEARKNDEYYAELDPEYAEMLTKLKSLQS